MMRMILADSLSKRYYLGDGRSNSVRDAIANLVRKPKLSQEKNELWALHDVNFAVNEGEALGIIGRNGAGKSTLLKILSRITKPTHGTAEIRGRVGSLLEVGTGFHNELTGRENIYLNGAILGMKRVEIEKRFDEIVAFSEIEKFLDTPVKHYSSGMYMRLAFSVAAHLEPDVLIVDEVLAVGDAGFQKKCLKKMRDTGESGRTVLFVSHDMSAITRLCSRVIWMKDGRIKADGDAKLIVGEYLHEQCQTVADRSWAVTEAPGNETARLLRIRSCDESRKTVSAIDIRTPVVVEMTYEVLKNGRILVPNLHFFNEQGVCIFVLHDWNGGWRDRVRDKGIYTSTAMIPGNFLAEGPIFVGAALTTYQPLEVHFVEWDAITFNVVDNVEGNSARGDFAGPLPGVVRPVFDWETEFSS
jgi:lipopolysaccharide transport system ATP-binding protein